MVALSLKICVRQCNVVKTMQFEPSTAVYDACRIIRERVPEAQTGQGENDQLVLIAVYRKDTADVVRITRERKKTADRFRAVELQWTERDPRLNLSSVYRLHDFRWCLH